MRSTEERVELLRQIREEQRQNEAMTEMASKEILQEEYEAPESTFKIRFLLACFLFFVYLLLCENRLPMLPFSAEGVTLELQRDFSSNLFDFIDTIPYTLEDVANE